MMIGRRRSSDEEQVVTLKDVFTMVTKLVGHVEAVDTRNLHADRIHEDHEQRLRALERWRYALPGSLVLAIASVVVTVLGIILK